MKDSLNTQRISLIHHKPLITFVRIFAALLLLSGIDDSVASEERWVDYDHPVTLRGIIRREFDMSFVDSDMSPLTDPKEVAKAVKEARHRPAAGAIPREAVPHWILRLDKPISLRRGADGDSYPEELNISEIDLGGASVNSGIQIPDREFGRTHFVVSGKLWHGINVHHLRPIMMMLSALKPAREVTTGKGE